MAEEFIWSELRDRKLGVTFRRQHPIGDFIADFVCIPLHLIIEIDGKYHETPEQKQDDATRTSFLEKMQYVVIRYRNEEVLNALPSVINDIKHHLNHLRQKSLTQ